MNQYHRWKEHVRGRHHLQHYSSPTGWVVNHWWWQHSHLIISCWRWQPQVGSSIVGAGNPLVWLITGGNSPHVRSTVTEAGNPQVGSSATRCGNPRVGSSIAVGGNPQFGSATAGCGHRSDHRLLGVATHDSGLSIADWQMACCWICNLTTAAILVSPKHLTSTLTCNHFPFLRSTSNPLKLF